MDRVVGVDHKGKDLYQTAEFVRISGLARSVEVTVGPGKQNHNKKSDTCYKHAYATACK